jgi:hypothetical protein
MTIWQSSIERILGTLQAASTATSLARAFGSDITVAGEHSKFTDLCVQLSAFRK